MVFEMGIRDKRENPVVSGKGGVTEREIEYKGGEEIWETWGFERRLRLGKGSELMKMCWKEMRERNRGIKKLSGWEEERWEFFERGGANRRR